VGYARRFATGDSARGLALVVQGSRAGAGAAALDAAVAAFARRFEAELAALVAAPGVWASALAGARAAARAFPLSMGEAFVWEWAELGRRSFRPQRRVDGLAALARVRPAHVLAAFRRLTRTDDGARIAAVDIFGKGAAVATPAGDAEPDAVFDAPEEW